MDNQNHVNMPIYQSLIDKLDEIGAFLQNRDLERLKNKDKTIDELLQKLNDKPKKYILALTLMFLAILFLATLNAITYRKLQQSEELASITTPPIHLEEPATKDKELSLIEDSIRVYALSANEGTNTRLDLIAEKLDALTKALSRHQDYSKSVTTQKPKGKKRPKPKPVAKSDQDDAGNDKLLMELYKIPAKATENQPLSPSVIDDAMAKGNEKAKKILSADPLTGQPKLIGDAP